MRPSRRLAGSLLVSGVLLAAGCSSSDGSASPVTEMSVPANDTSVVTVPSTMPGSAAAAPTTAPPATVAPTPTPTPSTSSLDAPPETYAPITTIPPGGAVAGTVPIAVGDVVLSDSFATDAETWDDTTWQVDTPGESSAASLDGAGVMETDERGTHEWVRAVAPDSIHDNASLFARITPIHSSEGTVFVGLHGDGEWRDASEYLPQSGVVVEYSYAAIFEGEIVIVVLDGTDETRVGPVSGPVLDDGQSADMRFEWIDGIAHVRVWRTGEPEPDTWDLETPVPDTDAGTVQVAYRDGVAQSMAFDQLILQRLP